MGGGLHEAPWHKYWVWERFMGRFLFGTTNQGVELLMPALILITAAAINSCIVIIYFKSFGFCTQKK